MLFYLDIHYSNKESLLLTVLRWPFMSFSTVLYSALCMIIKVFVLAFLPTMPLDKDEDKERKGVILTLYPV